MTHQGTTDYFGTPMETFVGHLDIHTPSGINYKGISMMHVWGSHFLCVYQLLPKRNKQKANSVLSALLQNEYMFQTNPGCFLAELSIILHNSCSGAAFDPERKSFLFSSEVMAAERSLLLCLFTPGQTTGCARG